MVKFGTFYNKKFQLEISWENQSLYITELMISPTARRIIEILDVA